MSSDSGQFDDEIVELIGSVETARDESERVDRWTNVDRSTTCDAQRHGLENGQCFFTRLGAHLHDCWKFDGGFGDCEGEETTRSVLESALAPLEMLSVCSSRDRKAYFSYYHPSNLGWEQ